jgi:hypothetical protein
MNRPLHPLGIAAAALKTLRAPAGLFVLRYASADDRIAPPRVRLQPLDPATASAILPPGMTEPELVSPGDGLVIQAHRDVDIAYVVEQTETASDAHLMLEPVSSLVRQPELPVRGSRSRLMIPDMRTPFLPLRGGPRRAVASRGATAGGQLLILGHVARRGDISAEPGEWLGGPDSLDAIEGLELRWPDPPRGFDVSFRLTVNDHGRRKLPEAGLGMFSGTRQRAAPIVGLDIGLEGRRPEGWIIDCQAVFQGQAVLTARGARIALRGKTGREPLTGLRLWIGEENAHREERIEGQSAYVAHTGAKAGRVRIFRPQA